MTDYKLVPSVDRSKSQSSGERYKEVNDLINKMKAEKKKQ